VLWSLPNILTYVRIILIPLFVLVYYLPYQSANIAAMYIFILAAVTDWLDGYFARKLNQFSSFGAFLDPVADKLMVAIALMLLLGDVQAQALTWNRYLFIVAIMVIIGREIAISALREWMATIGQRQNVAVSYIGKAKTAAQMTAIPFLLFQKPFLGLPIFHIGETLLFLAAILTLLSMFNYLRAAWPDLVEKHPK